MLEVRGRAVGHALGHTIGLVPNNVAAEIPPVGLEGEGDAPGDAQQLLVLERIAQV